MLGANQLLSQGVSANSNKATCKMRILRVVHRLYPPKVGGLSYYAHLLSAAQARDGHQVIIFTTREGNYPEHEFRDGYEIYRDRALGWPWENPITIGVLGRLLSRSDRTFDILAAHSHLMFTTNLAAFKRHLSKNPLVITNHGFRVKRSMTINFAQDIYLSNLGRSTLRAADYVVSFTGSERRKTIAAGVRADKAIVIPNGVDTKLFRPQPTEPVPNSIFWAGRFVPEKGLTYLLEAAKIVTTRFSNARFILVGYGEGLSKLLALIHQMKLERNVIILGLKSPDEIAAWLNKCTLFVLPSLSEGFPSSVLEAMACGKPVLVTSGIGLEEVVGDAGLYAHLSDSRGLAEAIQTILVDKGLARDLGRRGRRRASQHYDWHRVVSAINGLYLRALEEKRG